jgi:hypothetical protein
MGDLKEVALSPQVLIGINSVLSQVQLEGRHTEALAQIRHAVETKVGESWSNMPVELLDSGLSVALSTMYAQNFADQLSLSDWASICSYRRRLCDLLDETVEPTARSSFDWRGFLAHKSTLACSLDVATVFGLSAARPGSFRVGIHNNNDQENIRNESLPLTKDLPITPSGERCQRALLTPALRLELKDACLGWIMKVDIIVDVATTHMATSNSHLWLYF